MKLNQLIEHLKQIADKHAEAPEELVSITIDFEGTQYSVLLTDVAYLERRGTILISEDGSI